MRLGEVLNRIFRKKKPEDLVSRKPAEDIYKPIDHKIEDNSRVQRVRENIITEQSIDEQTVAEGVEKRNKYIIIGGLIIAVIAIVSLLGVVYTRVVNSAFKESKVIITLAGPEVVTVGDDVEYKIIVENGNRVDLNDVVIGLNFPPNITLQKESFIIDKNLSGMKINVGILKSKEKKSFKLKGVVDYSNNQTMVLKTFVRYQPNNISSSFQSDTSKSISLSQSAIDVLILSAETASDGEAVELRAVVRNEGNQEYQNLVLNMEYPDGFEFDNSVPKPVDDKKNEWLLDPLISGGQTEVRIFGKINGKINVVKQFNLTVYKKGENQNVLFRGSKNIRITPSKVILEENIDASKIQPGEFLKYTVSFKNNSTVPLRNLILKAHLSNKYVDKTSVNVENGYYDSRENVIVWKASEVSALKNLQAGEEGSVWFGFQIQENIPFSNGENKNPYLRSYSEIESLDIDSPIFENKKVTSRKTKLLINSVSGVVGKITYLPEDNNGENPGNLKVDKKTFLHIKFDMTNTTNDLKDVKLLTGLPAGVTWERQIYPEGDNLQFNTRTNLIEWDIGYVKAGTGETLPAESAEFVIGVVPSVNSIGHTVELIKDIKIIAKDVFTNSNIEYGFEGEDSATAVGLEGGVVSATE